MVNDARQVVFEEGGEIIVASLKELVTSEPEYLSDEPQVYTVELTIIDSHGDSVTLYLTPEEANVLSDELDFASQGV